MNFVSLEFAILLVSLATLLFLIKNQLIRKLVLLAASCVFYAWWDLRFLGLLAIVITLDYYLSHFLVKTTNLKISRRLLLWIGIIINLGILGFFKYFNFFIDTFNVFVGTWGWQLGTLSIILPIGISFYTFQSLSYIIDVYKGVTEPAGSLLDYAIFIGFFPKLVAGPIVRAKEFLPQLERGILIDPNNLTEGAQLFLRGMLKKLVVADNLAIMVEQVYKSPSIFSSPTVWLAIASYSIQILFDFWGYTDMARGIGKMLGFDLPLNFNLPYTSQSMTEFWNRWHISLSTWFRDYIFFPFRNTLMRSKHKLSDWFAQTLATLVTMLASGIWHGAGIYLVLEHLPGVKITRRSWRSYKAWLKTFLIFLLVTITWVPFRSPNWQTTLIIFKKLLFVGMQYRIEWHFGWAAFTVPLILISGWLARRFEWKWPMIPIQKSYLPAFILLETLIIFFFAPLGSNPFIYFRF
jgi:alginate O-acetyltransferase complex protein AlgI